MEASLKDISKEKKRIGGNWAVAGIDLVRKYQREYAKYFLQWIILYSIYSSTKRSHLKVEGGFLIIILNLSVENLKERLNNRHNEAEWVVTDLVEVCKLQNHTIDDFFN